MQAYLLDQPTRTLTPAELGAEGILYYALPTDEAAYAEPLQKLRDQRGYVQMDEVKLGDQTPNLPALLDKFFREHLHTDEEIRFVVEGAGIFDLRNKDDQWMRVHVAPGDLIIVPANKYHRFTLDEQRKIVCKRLFQNSLGWEAINRA